MNKLLIADDDKDISRALEVFGKARGFEVFCAYRGDEALEIARKERPQAILLDVMMPGLDGRDVMKKLKDEGLADECVIIFVSARGTQHDRLLGLELGADDYETKPLELRRLFDKIDRLLEKRAAS